MGGAQHAQYPAPPQFQSRLGPCRAFCQLPPASQRQSQHLLSDGCLASWSCTLQGEKISTPVLHVRPSEHPLCLCHKRAHLSPAPPLLFPLLNPHPRRFLSLHSTPPEVLSSPFIEKCLQAPRQCATLPQ